MGGKSGGEQEMTQKVVPWKHVQEPLKNLYGYTQNALGNIRDYYPGQTYPNFTPLQEAGMLGNLNYAQNYMAPAAMGYQQQLGQYMDAPLNITNDPAVQNMMQANRNQADRYLSDSLRGIRSGAQANDMYGSSRQGNAEGRAIGDVGQALFNANSQTALGAYGTAAGLAKQGMTLMPSAFQLGFTPGDMAQQVGAQYQGMVGQGINEDVTRYGYPEQSLWDKMSMASNIYNGAGSYGTTKGTQPGSTSSPLAGALGGGLSGLGTAAALGETAAGTAMLGAIPGGGWTLAAIGALSGIL